MSVYKAGLLVPWNTLNIKGEDRITVVRAGVGSVLFGYVVQVLRDQIGAKKKQVNIKIEHIPVHPCHAKLPNDDRTQDYSISFLLYNSPHRSPFLPFWLGSHLSIQQIKSSVMARWARQPQVCSFKCSLWQLVNRTAPEFILATRLEMERIKTGTVRVAMVIRRLWSVLSSQLLHDFVFPLLHDSNDAI